MSDADTLPLHTLLGRIRGCTLCAASLPQGPRPVLQAHVRSRILIAGQAPGRRVHASGVPFDDASGERLRDWLQISRDTFYDARQVAIVPMGFCYPGSNRSGDLPPRRECATAWRAPLLAHLREVRLTLLVGRHAMAWHLRQADASVTATVGEWRRHAPMLFPLPHPSPRNQGWLSRNPWFEAELLPTLRRTVGAALAD